MSRYWDGLKTGWMAWSRGWLSVEQNLVGGQSVAIYSRDLYWVHFYWTWWGRVYPQQTWGHHQTRRRRWYARSSWHPEGPQQAGEVAWQEPPGVQHREVQNPSPGKELHRALIYAVGHPAGKLPHKICTSTNIINIDGFFQCVKSCLVVFCFQML